MMCIKFCILVKRRKLCFFICDYCATYHIRISTCTYSNFKENEIWTKYTRRGSRESYEKTGTPTMGGLTFLISIIITSLIAIFFVDKSNPIILLLFVTIGFGLIGFIDDYIIVVKKNNQGLTSKQKFLAQIGIAVIFLY